MGWTGVDISTPRLPQSVPGVDADPTSFFFGGGEGVSGVGDRSGLEFNSLPYIFQLPSCLRRGICLQFKMTLASLKTILQHQIASCFREIYPLNWARGPRWELHLQTPFRGSARYPAHILDRTTPLH